MHACRHTQIQTHTNTDIDTHTHTHTHTANTHAHTHTYMLGSYEHKCTNKYIYTHVPTSTYGDHGIHAHSCSTIHPEASASYYLSMAINCEITKLRILSP